MQDKTNVPRLRGPRTEAQPQGACRLIGQGNSQQPSHCMSGTGSKGYRNSTDVPWP